MSAQVGCIASLLSFALLAGVLPAQEKPKTVDALRKENAALRQQVKTLRSQLDAKTSKAAKKVPGAGQKVGRGFVWRAGTTDPTGVRRKVVLSKRKLAGRGSTVEVLLKPGKAVTFERFWVLEGKARPSRDDDYGKALKALSWARSQLETTRSPAKSREIVDRIERILLDIRRELWLREQAEKKRATDLTGKSAKQASVPTDSKDELFFSFRRF